MLYDMGVFCGLYCLHELDSIQKIHCSGVFWVESFSLFPNVIMIVGSNYD